MQLKINIELLADTESEADCAKLADLFSSFDKTRCEGIAPGELVPFPYAASTCAVPAMSVTYAPGALPAENAESSDKQEQEPDPKPEPEKPAPARRRRSSTPKPDTEPEKEKESTNEEDATIEDIRAILASLTQSGKRDEVAALLKKYEAKKLTEVKESDYNALMADARLI